VESCLWMVSLLIFLSFRIKQAIRAHINGPVSGTELCWVTRGGADGTPDRYEAG